MQNKIKELKLLVEAHEIANEYDIMTEESPDYKSEMESYVGLHPYEIVERIKSLIRSL